MLEDAQGLDYFAEVAFSREIIADGRSAHHQVLIYERATREGADAHEALAAVVDWLAEETLQGVAGD